MAFPLFSFPDRGHCASGRGAVNGVVLTPCARDSRAGTAPRNGTEAGPPVV